MIRPLAAIPVALALASALVLSACASTTDGSAAGTGTVNLARPLTQAQLSRLVLRASDFPPATPSRPHTGDSTQDDQTTEQQLATCLGVPTPNLHHVAQATAPDFNLDNVTTFSSSATSFSTQQPLTSLTALLDNSGIEQCFEQVLRTGLASSDPGVTVDSVDVQVTKGSGGGPSTIHNMVQAQIQLSEGAQAATVYVREAFIIGNLVGADVAAEQTSGSLSPTTFLHYATIVANRVASAAH